jgi:hypothetical protein
MGIRSESSGFSSNLIMEMSSNILGFQIIEISYSHFTPKMTDSRWAI